MQAGGVTELDVFAFAMHGINPDREPNETEAARLEYYRRLEDKFETGPVAWKATSYYDLPFVSALAWPKHPEDGSSLLKFAITKESPGYVGTVNLPITNLHSWKSLGGTEQPGRSLEDTVVLARVKLKSRPSKDYHPGNDLSDGYAAGWKEIGGLREFGKYVAGDEAFWGRIAIFRANTPGE